MKRNLIFILALVSIISYMYANECEDYLADAKRAFYDSEWAKAKHYYELVKQKCNMNVEDKISQCDEKLNPTITVVTDCQGHTYKVVKIDNMLWMAENLQCTQYDTHSRKSGTFIPNADSYGDFYYTDSRSVTYGNNEQNKNFSDRLTSSQRSKLGLLYSFYAAVGYSSYEVNQIPTTKIQGICPNGWHLPTATEWNMINIIAVNRAGYKLKSISGWYEGGNGNDMYNFEALPSGTALRNKIYQVGRSANWWSATIYDDTRSYGYKIRYNDGELSQFTDVMKDAQSVRCVKD